MKVPALLLATAVFTSSQSAPANVKAEADKFQQKLQQIVAHGNAESGAERRTSVSQGEVNAYLRVRGPELLPVGVTDATVAAHGAGRVSGRAVVDLDVIREKKGSGSWLDLKSYLTGTLPVTASGVLHTKDGMARFELESAEVSGIPVPKTFLQEVVAYYTRSRDYPNGVSLDQTYELPANIREIQVGQGSAIVVQ
jgi:hypothetical protein